MGEPKDGAYTKEGTKEDGSEEQMGSEISDEGESSDEEGVDEERMKEMMGDMKKELILLTAIQARTIAKEEVDIGTKDIV